MANLSYGMQGSSYYDLARLGRVFVARAVVTAPVIYTTAAGTGGPLLWNGSQTVNAVILGVGYGVTTVTSASGALGITGSNGQTTAPTSTTAIDSVGNTRIGGPAPQCTTYRVGTVANAGSFLYPVIQLGTGALTTDYVENSLVDIAGAIVVPPNCWASIAATATATALVAQLSLIWAEIPL